MFIKMILHKNHTSGALWPLRVYSRLLVSAGMDSSTSSGQDRKSTKVVQDNVSPWGSLTPLTQRSAQGMNQLFNESVKRQQVTGNRICGPERQNTSASPPDQPSEAGTSAGSVVDIHQRPTSSDPLMLQIAGGSEASRHWRHLPWTPTPTANGWSASSRQNITNIRWHFSHIGAFPAPGPGDSISQENENCQAGTRLKRRTLFTTHKPWLGASSRALSLQTPFIKGLSGVCLLLFTPPICCRSPEPLQINQSNTPLWS